jgi:dimethylhistidine N-methyltransferase
MNQKLPSAADTDAALQQEILDGLAAPQKRLPSKLFYDAAGSRLFDAICELPEYYVTRTEAGIMRAHAADIAATLGRGVRLVEFGSGSSLKTRLLLDQLQAPLEYVPVDISDEHLHTTAVALREAYPQLPIRPLTADFTRDLQLPEGLDDTAATVYFPGSTIGNFEPEEALGLLQRIRRLAGAKGGLLIGADLRKPLPVLEAAYDDAAGVTAAFNLNLLRRLNREFGADFDLGAFAHRAVWNERLSRIEMHLVATRDLGFSIFGRAFRMQAGATLHTENSHKYSLDALAQMSRRSGFSVAACWTDPQQWFAVQWWKHDARASMALAA